LIEAGESHLLVEMRMYDASRSIIKAILWTKFTCVNIKTSRKEIHPPEFMTIAHQMLTEGIDIGAGLRARVRELARKNEVATEVEG
jgi:acyl-CoA thioester hydrolase